MGVVTEYLVKRIEHEVLANHLVVWFDPGGQYAELARSLTLPDSRVARYEGSFFALRRSVDDLLNGDRAPKLLVYVPLDETETHEALAELTAAGVVMRPGERSPARNTRPSVVVRAALKAILPADMAQQLAAQVEAGALSLADVERVLESGAGEELGFLGTLFEVGTAQEIALAFLTSAARDEELVSRGLLGQLAQLLNRIFVLSPPNGELSASSPAELRAQLARLLLARELADALPGSAPAALQQHASPNRAARETTARLLEAWRNRLDLRGSYVEGARRVERELGIDGIELALEQLGATDTFLAVERRLQEQVEKELLRAPSMRLVEEAEARIPGFWSQEDPTHLARWATIAAAGRVRLEAARLRQEVRAAQLSAAELARRYATGDHPWCQLDTVYRHLERLYLGLDLEPDAADRVLEQLVARAREEYAAAIADLAERFTHALAEAGFELSGLPRQREIFGRYVRPALERGKTAYVLVDALRFELARELLQGVGEHFECELEAVVASFPTITEIGMAALMPGIEDSPRLAGAGPGKLALEVDDGRPLRTRADRLKWLQERIGHGRQVFSTRLETFTPPNRRTREAAQAADLIVLWSQEIDELCEGDNVLLARSALDTAVDSLRRAFRSLGSLGVEPIVVTADHGYLFAEEPPSGMKIDSPGGEEADRHRRVWIGRGGAAAAGLLRARASDFGWGGDLEIATPWNTAVFRAGGARAYFHGGLSPQELIIPVAQLRPRAAQPASTGARITWTLTLGSARITTRFCTITVAGESDEMLEVVPPRVRLEVRIGGRTISTPVAASYGYDAASQEVALELQGDQQRTLKPCSITLQLDDPPAEGTAVAHLVDARTGAELVRSQPLDIKLSI